MANQPPAEVTIGIETEIGLEAETGIATGTETEFDLEATMRDGTILRSNVFTPDEPGPFPVVMIRLPYNKDRPMVNSYGLPDVYASHCYIVVSQDVRGQGPHCCLILLVAGIVACGWPARLEALRRTRNAAPAMRAAEGLPRLRALVRNWLGWTA